jgi:hypothetical protein
MIASFLRPRFLTQVCWNEAIEENGGWRLDSITGSRPSGGGLDTHLSASTNV